MTGPVAKECFVIMPFGEKADAEGKLIDLDVIYNFIIKNAVEGMGLTCVRCDEIAEAGWIHSKMFEHIYSSEVAVVDITTLNPNVFYELGVRHALAESVTVLMRRKGTKIPFNIQGLQVIEYDEKDIANVEEVKKKVVDCIRNGLKLKIKDSPVHEVLRLRIATEHKKLTRTVVFSYGLKSAPSKQICLITGDLRNVKNQADVWVSSENTNMRMGRHYDRSISSVIRYLGAKKDAMGNVVEDQVADELGAIVGDNGNVAPGTIIATGAGEIEKSHGVKLVFHVASVFGQVGVGFTPIADIALCVRNSLNEAAFPKYKDVHIKSILVPLIGCGTARGNLEEIAPQLLGAAIAYLEENPDCEVEKVCFLTWTDRELAVCQRFLDEAHEIVIV